MRFVEANYYTVLWHVHHRGKSSENYSEFIVIRQILFSFLCYYKRKEKYTYKARTGQVILYSKSNKESQLRNSNSYINLAHKPLTMGTS